MSKVDLALLLATSGHSGVDRVMKNLVPAFVRHGLSVDLLGIRNHGPQWENVPDGARVVNLGAAHVNTAFVNLVRYLRSNRPEALLADKYKVNRAALLARAAARTGTRVAVRIGTTVTDDLTHRDAYSRWFEKLSIRTLYPKADAILVPSQGAADDLSAIAGLPKTAITVVPSPVATPRLYDLAGQPATHPWLQANQPPVIVGMGELSSRKNFQMLLRAFAIVRRERMCRLIIGGEGRQRDALQRLGVELGVAADFELPGFLDNPYVYMKHAKVFALTSEWEGMPVVLIEALALGTPCVATDCPSGPREILAGGRIGPLVQRGDITSLALRIHELLNAPPARADLLAAAAPYALEASAARYLQALGLRSAK